MMTTLWIDLKVWKNKTKQNKEAMGIQHQRTSYRLKMKIIRD